MATKEKANIIDLSPGEVQVNKKNSPTADDDEESETLCSVASTFSDINDENDIYLSAQSASVSRESSADNVFEDEIRPVNIYEKDSPSVDEKRQHWQRQEELDSKSRSSSVEKKANDVVPISDNENALDVLTDYLFGEQNGKITCDREIDLNDDEINVVKYNSDRPQNLKVKLKNVNTPKINVTKSSIDSTDMTDGVETSMKNKTDIPDGKSYIRQLSTQLSSQDSSLGSPSSCTSSQDLSSPSRYLDEHQLTKCGQYTVYEIISQLEIRIPRLLEYTDFIEYKPYPDLRFIKRRTAYNSDVLFRSVIADKMINLGIVDLFNKVWTSTHDKNDVLTEKQTGLKNMLQMISALWNTSDISRNMCEYITKGDIISLLITDLKSSYLDVCELSDDNRTQYVKGCIGIMHNICRHYSAESRDFFRNADAVTVLQKYLLCGHLSVKSKVLFVLSYIINEDENEVINADDKNISFMVDILKASLDSEGHFSQTFGFCVTELLCGLNHLASNDLNKEKMVRNGALSLYVRLLNINDGSPQEVRLATQGLWAFAFNEYCKEQMLEEPGCVAGLQDLSRYGTDDETRHLARGVLWEIQAQRKQISRLLSQNEDIPHIMISYQWDSKPLVLRIKDRLKEAGFKVWMDVENMTGSTLEAMALAVERAAVVLMCMSQKYKDSPNCRSEAEYSYHLRKNIVPLKTQENYMPDGWLGIIAGTRLYFDFSLHEMYEGSFYGLTKELGHRGKLITSASSSTNITPEISHQVSMSMDKKIHAFSTFGVCGWGSENVIMWLKDNNLGEMEEKFADYDGELLSEMRRMRKDSSAFLYQQLKEEKQMNLKQILQFSRALSKLPS